MSILYYLRDMAVTMLWALPVWALVRWLWHRRRREPVRWGRELLLALLVLYLVALTGETILPKLELTHQGIVVTTWNYSGCNYIPLSTIRQMLSSHRDAPVYAAVNLLGNVLVFAPLGFLPPLVWRRFASAVPTVLLGGGCSLVIELVQPLVGRNRDVDDLILNTLGCGLGWLLWLLLRHMRKRL